MISLQPVRANDRITENLALNCVQKRLNGGLSSKFTGEMLHDPEELSREVNHYLVSDPDCAEELASLGVFQALKTFSLSGNESALECLTTVYKLSLSSTNKVFDETTRPSPLCIEFLPPFPFPGKVFLRALRPQHHFGADRPNFEVGFTLWGAALVFSRFAQFHQDMFKNKSVLELGSGMGLGGIVVAKYCQPLSVTLSDFHPDVVENCRTNCRFNDVKCTCLILDWEAEVEEEEEQRYDVIVGCDVVCQPKDCESICNVLRLRLKKKGGTSIFVLGSADSRFGVEAFVHTFQTRGFRVTKKEDVEGSLQDLLLPTTDVDLLVGKAKMYNTYVVEYDDDGL